MDDPRLSGAGSAAQVFERMIGEQIGRPVRYDPATGEFVVVELVVVGEDDPEQEPKQ